MKKQLLFGSALFAAITAFPQNGRPRPANMGIEDANKRIIARLEAEIRHMEAEPTSQPANTNEPISGDETPTASRTSSYVSVWNAISSSINPYGVVVASTRPLQYNEDLNAVTFVHRAGPEYTTSPQPTNEAKSGVILAMVTQNWGASWDSTCLWNDNANWGRYPQGALLAVPGSTNMYDAHLVGSTAITSQSNGWIGNGYFSKQMGQANYNTTAPATNSFLPVLNPITGKSDFTVYDFQAMDNGKVVALGYVNNDPNGTATTFGYRGARVVKGSFVAGNMIWTSDSIIPSVLNNSSGSKILIARPRMVWSEDGQVGYVIQIGAAANSTLNNRGYQPIIHRTNNGGTSWAPVNGIDFNLPAMSTVTNMVLSPNSNSNVTIPYFNTSEGLGLTVDKDNKLHIACTLFGTSSPDPDSLNYIFTFNSADGETYRYRHTPGFRPYLYDFTGDGLPNSPWKVTLIDSLSSESPGTNAGTDPNGFTTNPWIVEGGDKVEVESRIQCSRTPDGKYIVYTWTESDTLFTTNAFKWNELPNIKARMMDVTAQTIHPMEINVTKPGNNPAITTNTNVSSRAYLHYASPKCALAQTVAVGASGPAIILPLTTSRPYGIPLSQTSKVIHRYMSALLNFGNVSQNDIELPKIGISVGVSENALTSTTNSFLYPNPAKGSTSLQIDLKDNGKVDVSVYNMIGQVVKTTSADSQIGQNIVNVDLEGLSKGVYMVNVKVANVTSTKKLIVE